MEDLRDWLVKLESVGALKRIDGADWDLEIGCIQDPKVRGEDRSVLLFDNIKDYPKGYRVAITQLCTTKLVALAMNMPEASKLEQVKVLRQKLPQWQRSLNKFPPKPVETGPVLENVQSGADVDVFKFPAPRYNELDGGRYIGTADAVVTRDPDTGEVNLGTYRIMLHDKKTVGIKIAPYRHGRRNLEKYHAAGRACPVAVSAGHHPLLFVVACHDLQGCEYNWAGAIRKKPIEVITEEVTGLPIPADSEIVIAGWIPPGKTRPEGPFGEWTGYYAGGREPEAIIEVERIYYRNDPILLGAPSTRQPHITNVLPSHIFGSAILLNELEQLGVPDVRGAWISEEGLTTFTVVSIKQRFAGHAKRAALIASQSRTMQIGRYVIVVDEDIDPTDLKEVIWAMGLRSDPEKDIDIIRNCRNMELDPLHIHGNPLFNSVAIIDACKPYGRLDEFPAVIDYSPDLVTKCREKWKHIFGETQSR